MLNLFRYPFLRANPVQDAPAAMWNRRLAPRPAVPYDEMGVAAPKPFRDYFHKVLLYLVRVRLFCQPEPVVDPPHVRVNGYPLKLPIGVAQDYVCRLSGNAWQLQEAFHGVRNFAIEIVDYHFGRIYYVPCLVPVKARWPYLLFKRFQIRPCKIRRCFVFPEQS